jgi:hypothetical protein
MKQSDNHSVYTRAHYRHFVAHNGNWHYCIDDNGNAAAIAVKHGALSSHFGNVAHLRRILEREASPGRARSISARLSAIERAMI